ncbi:LiaF transmembrane domain-containing protein [Cellvibrio sp. NN19]|uniref:LiaF transmembrane domain-containing protein n=1 Tax=Cellvibrio chitinivorans TaxID=3102792 RepID=UPI002B4026C9|nr:hypothetical protein [Cellvibrio sp. NN19]
MSIDEKNKEEHPVAAPSPSVASTKSSASGWAVGLAVVVIGGLLLARNLGYELFFLDFHNWWAFLIMCAAIGPLQQAFSYYRKEGLSANVANSLVSAGAIIFVALMFLLDLSFWVWWPVFVIIGGLYMMTSRNRS